MIRFNTLVFGCQVALLASGCSALTKWPDVNDNTAKKTGGSGGDDAVGGSVNKGGGTNRGGSGGSSVVGGGATTAGRNGSGGGTTSTAGTASTSGSTGTSPGGDTSIGGNANVSGGATNVAGTGALIGGTSNQGGGTTVAGGATGSGGTTTLSGGTTSEGGTVAATGGNTSTGLGGQGGGATATGGSAMSGGSTAIGTGGGAGTTLAIATPTLATGKTGVAYSGTVTASGASQYTWSIASGSLPTGVSLQNTTSATVTIAGTPKEAGLFPLTLSVTDGDASKTVDVSLAVTHRVAFLADRSVVGRQEVFALDVGTESANTPIKVNATVAASVKSFQWSPDGSRIAYLSNTDELLVTLIDSPGVASSVATGVSSFVWLNSGETLAYVVGANAFVKDISSAASANWTVQQISLPVASTGSTKTIDSLYPSPVGRALGVKWLDFSDTSHAPVATGTHYVNWPAGGAITSAPLMTHSFSVVTSAPTFTSDGLIAVVYSAADGASAYDLTNPTSPVPKSLASSQDSYNTFFVDPTSQSVLFAMYPGRATIFQHGTGSWTSSTVIVRDFTPTQNGPWSTDGKHVLFVVDKDLRTVANAKTAAVNSDASLLPAGFLLNAFTDIPAYQYNWSPDSGWVAFKADKTTDGIYDLFLVRWPGPGPSTSVSSMTAAPGVAAWKFSPNSRAIAYVGNTYSSTATTLHMSTLGTSGEATPGLALTAIGSPTIRSDIDWLPGSRVLVYRAADAGGDQLHGVHVSSSGGTSSSLSLTGSSTNATGVTTYQVAPLPN